MKPSVKRLVVVLGMHRSGTSAITRGLACLGVSLGERLLPGVEGDNRKGYFEDIDINALNVEMLRVINSDWSRVAPIDAMDVAQLEREGFILRAINILRAKASACAIFGFKDPRVAKLMPFWAKVFDYSGFEVSYVLAMRNPMSVAKSLSQRAGFAPEHSYMLWLDHVLISAFHTNGATRVLVDYDHFMVRASQDLERIAQRLRLVLDPVAVRSFEIEFLENGLQHSVFAPSDLRLDPKCPTLVAEVYLAFMEVVENPEFDQVEFAQQIVAWSEDFNKMKASLRWTDHLVSELHNVYRILQYRDGQVFDAIRTAVSHETDLFANAFESDWYMAKYPDVAESVLAPYEHYRKIGIAEGRAPCADPARFLHDVLIKRFRALLEQAGQAEAARLSFEQEVTLRHSEREKALQMQADVASEALTVAQQKISALHENHAFRTARLTREHADIAQRQSELQSKQTAALEQALSLSRTELKAKRDALVKLEQDFDEQLGALTTQLKQARENDAQSGAALAAYQATFADAATAYIKREAALLEELQGATLVVTSQSQYLADRERQFDRLIQVEQQRARRELADAARGTSVLEQLHQSRIAELQQEVRADQILQAGKLKSISLEAVQLTATLKFELAKAAAQEENERQLRHMLHTRAVELERIEKRLASAEAAHARMTRAIASTIDGVRNTCSWKITGRLRRFGVISKDTSVTRMLDALLRQEAPLSDLTSNISPNDALPVRHPVRLPSPEFRADHGVSEQTAVSDDSNHNGLANMASITNQKPPKTVNQLLAYSDREFVIAAYHALLNRPPDQEGMDHYLGRIRSGISKHEILLQLHRSAEAKNNANSVSGLEARLRSYKLLKIPVLGMLLKVIGMRDAEGSTARNVRLIVNQLYVLEKNLSSQFQQINGEVGKVRQEVASLTESLRQVAGSRSVSVNNVVSRPQGYATDGLSEALQNRDVGNWSPASDVLAADKEQAEMTVLPVDWPRCAATSDEIDTMVERLAIRNTGKFIRGGHGFKNEARNRHPYRMLNTGESVNQYFKCADRVLSSLTLFFYTYNAKNGATVRVNIYIVLPNLKENVVATRVFEGDDIADCAAVHLWLKPAVPDCHGQLFRIEIHIQKLEEQAHITVALGESTEDTIRAFEMGEDEKFALSFRVNNAPSPFSKKYFAFISGCPGDAFRYRCVHVGEALKRLGYGVDIFQPGEQDWKSLSENYKVVILHRVPYDLAVETFLRRAKSAGIIVVFDTDDLVFDPALATQIDAFNEMSVSDQNRYHDGLVRYNKTIAKCDVVTVSTEKLEQEVARLWPEKQIEIIRNRISREMWDLAVKAGEETKFDTKEVLIAYFSGSKTHRKDFATCEQAVLRILKKYDNAVLLIVGHLDVPTSFSAVSAQIRTIPFVAWEELASLYRKVDINLAPLEYGVAFTESKSELKFLEAALLSVPTVAARIGAYKIAIADGVDGVLCATPDEWFRGIERLIIDRNLRMRIGKAAYEKVAAECTTFRNGLVIQEKFKRLVSVARLRPTPARRSVAFIVRAPIAKTGGGYKKIFILANFLKQSFDVKMYIDPIAHMAEMADAQIRAYCEINFGFAAKDVRVGYDQIEPADFAIATNWPTAAVAQESAIARVKFYFVQDYEPEFYAKDDPYYAPAEASYDLDLGIVTIGEYLRNRLAEKGGWCRSIPFAMDNSFLNIDFRPMTQNFKGCSIIFFARPGIPRRNFEAGVEALRLVNEAFPEVKISMYGLEKFHKLPFIYENLGQLSQEALASVMSESDIHLSFSLTNISTVIYEAMAAGCACVEADVEAVRPMVKDGHDCILAEPTGPGTFKALSKLIKSPELRQTLGRNAQTYAKTLNEKNMCVAFEALMDEAWMLRP